MGEIFTTSMTLESRNCFYFPAAALPGCSDKLGGLDWTLAVVELVTCRSELASARIVVHLVHPIYSPRGFCPWCCWLEG